MAAVGALIGALHGGERRNVVAEKGIQDQLLLQNSHTGMTDMKRNLYILLDTEDTYAALFVSGFLLLCILASTVCFVLESMPSLENLSIWYTLEAIFVVVFSIEYLLRLYATNDSTLTFMRRPMNIIDLVAILPFYIDLVTILMSGRGGSWDLRVLRALRLMRIFKIGRYSHQMQLISGAVAKSVSSLTLLLFMLSIMLVVFGTLMHSVERGTWNGDKNCYVRHDGACSPYGSIPESFWWVITTMTTVGYGDTFPITLYGKLIAGVCMVVGILCVALPTTVLGVQFGDAYTELEAESKVKDVVAALPPPGERGTALEEAMEALVTDMERFEALQTKLFGSLVQHRGDPLEDEHEAFVCLTEACGHSLATLIEFVDKRREA